MSKVNISKEIVNEATALCYNIKKSLTETRTGLKRKLDKGKNDWNDEKFNQLEIIIQECRSSMSKTIRDLENIHLTLMQITCAIYEYENINFYSGNSYANNLLPAQMSFSGILGGSYAQCDAVRKQWEGTIEVHHIPANGSHLLGDKGPAITMFKEDHEQTASHGTRGEEAREYRDKQVELMIQGRYSEAMQMDIQDIRARFDNKYDDAINAAILYFEKLVSEGRT